MNIRYSTMLQCSILSPPPPMATFLKKIPDNGHAWGRKLVTVTCVADANFPPLQKSVNHQKTKHVYRGGERACLYYNCTTYSTCMQSNPPLLGNSLRSTYIPLSNSLNLSPDMVQVMGVVSLVTGSVLRTLNCIQGSPTS